MPRKRVSHYEKDVHVRLSAKTHEKLEAEAKELGVTLTWLLRAIVEKYVKEKDSDLQ